MVFTIELWTNVPFKKVCHTYSAVSSKKERYDVIDKLFCSFFFNENSRKFKKIPGIRYATLTDRDAIALRLIESL